MREDHKKSPLLLASKSPRRREILSQMGIDFKVITKEVDESFPPELSPEQVAVYIAEKKALVFQQEVDAGLLLSADTIVCLNEEIIGKPRDREDAFEILSRLSGNMHRVITAVSFLEEGNVESFYDQTEVYFSALSSLDINHYIDKFQPYDKAGAYGIQEWIGYVGIQKIVGSYSTVMGLPSSLVYSELKRRSYC